MEITVDEKTQRAVDTAMRYFLQVHRNGTKQDTETVCAYVQKVLYDRNIEVSYEYVEARWHELVSQGPQPREKKRPSPLSVSERHKKTQNDWKKVCFKVYGYMRSLPPAEPLDESAAQHALGDSLQVLEAFKYNGRAVENLLDKEEKQKVRALESAGLVRSRSVMLKIKGPEKKSGGRDYIVYYWEPHMGRPDEKAPETTENKCLKDEEELNVLDTEIADVDGADVYLKDETWGAQKDKK